VLTKEKNGTKHKDVIPNNTLTTFIKEQTPDIVCLQEIRCSESFDVSDKLKLNELEYTLVGTNCSRVKAGYSGTLVLSKQTPLNVIKDFPRYPATHELNGEGRVITVEFSKFVLINTYVPNAKPDLSRLPFRVNSWEAAMREHVNDMKKKFNKPIILCGDLNVAPTEIDVHNPKSAKGKHGFTKEEREAFQALIKQCDMTDAFRMLYPDKIAYSWWSNFANSRAKNKGWQIDKFVISSKLNDKVKDVTVHGEYFGSDHAPVLIKVEL
jgi:exodeoxyribonuclease-3